MSSIPDLSTGSPPPVYPDQPDFEHQAPPVANLPASSLPAPIHIYDIPVHLRRLVTLDISVVQGRATTTNDLRELLKCFHHTIPRIRMQTKPQLIDSFIYYVVPILRSPHVFDSDRGILYSFDVPFDIELEHEPEAHAGDAGNGGLNQGAAHNAA